MNDTPPQHKKVTFDRTINLGHVLTFIGFVGIGLGVWATLDKRVVVLEEARIYQKLADEHQDKRNSDAFQALKETLARLDRQVERVADRLDKLGVKP